jgi:general secretion pathway protein G
MEEKRIKICCTLWSFSGFWHNDQFSYAGSNRNDNKLSFHLKTSGFTLIELLITIAIVGILVTGLLYIIDPSAQLKKSRDSKRKADIKIIQSALEMFRADCGDYPISDSNAVPDPLVLDGETCLNNATSVIYLNKVPQDPQSETNYYYNYVPETSGGEYKLWACLENSNDPENQEVKPEVSCPSGIKYQPLNP